MAKDLTGAILALSDFVIHTEIKMRAMDEILEEKRIVTREEIDGKFNAVHRREFNKLKAELIDAFKDY